MNSTLRSSLTIALFSFAAAFQCQAGSYAVFENQTETPATVKILGNETTQLSLSAKSTERRKLKGGEYYFKVRFDLSGGPKYGIGPFFELVDEFRLEHEVILVLKSPALAGLYEISKDQFDSESGDSSLLRKSYRESEAWVRWANIVLTVVSEKGEEASKMVFRMFTEIEKKPITSEDHQPLSVSFLTDGTKTKVSVHDIIKQHGQPSARRTLKRSVNSQTKEEVEFDVYCFDVIELLCRKGSDDAEFLSAPRTWFIEGIRKKAQRALERAK